jgi:fluoride exporter
MRIALIASFGAVGTLCRYGLHLFVAGRAGTAFPYGTLLINLLGCFFLALIGQYALNHTVISDDLRVAIGVGFFGGFTTFSSFGWETANLINSNRLLPALTYVAASVFVGIFLSVAGIRLANQF